MKQGRRFGFSAEQKLDVWRRWKAGQTQHERVSKDTAIAVIVGTVVVAVS
jgi:hypothetical protein